MREKQLTQSKEKEKEKERERKRVIQESGAPPGESKRQMSSEKKSNFAVTCSLLSQYLKKKGSIKDLRIDPQLPPKGLYCPPTTMNLLPGADISADNNQTNTSQPEETATKSMDLFPLSTAEIGSTPDTKVDAKEPKNAQLTMFYGGKVLVFDNFPSEKVDDLMKFASKDCSASSSAAKLDKLPENNTFTSDNAPAPAQAQANTELPMPIARRASLHRFFEKRKDRINLKAPYEVNGASASGPSNPEGSPSWLGLGRDVSNLSTSSDSKKQKI